jgi:ketosteroid isomerase-like protein
LSDTSGTYSAADIARRFMASYTANDTEAMAAMCAPDAMLDYVAMGDRGRGKIHEIGVPMWRMFIDDFEHFRPDVVEVWEDPIKKTALVATINRGIERKDVAGIPSRGRELAAPHIFIVAIGDDGLIVKLSAYWDYLTMYRQIGFPRDLATEIAGA